MTSQQYPYCLKFTIFILMRSGLQLKSDAGAEFPVSASTCVQYSSRSHNSSPLRNRGIKRRIWIPVLSNSLVNAKGFPPRRHSTGVFDPARVQQNAYTFLEPLSIFHHTALERCCQRLREGNFFRDIIYRLSGGALAQNAVSTLKCPSTPSSHFVCISCNKNNACS